MRRCLPQQQHRQTRTWGMMRMQTRGRGAAVGVRWNARRSLDQPSTPTQARGKHPSSKKCMSLSFVLAFSLSSVLCLALPLPLLLAWVFPVSSCPVCYVSFLLFSLVLVCISCFYFMLVSVLSFSPVSFPCAPTCLPSHFLLVFLYILHMSFPLALTCVFPSRSYVSSSLDCLPLLFLVSFSSLSVLPLSFISATLSC